MSMPYTVTTGAIGMTASALGVISTFQEQLDWGVRISGGGLGIVIGLITLYRLIHHKKQ